MQRNQDIKGFTLIELIVVVAIVGIISGLGYPRFVSWKTDREVRAASEKVASMLRSISTQAQKGYYPFVQFEVSPGSGSVKFTSKGMTTDTFNSKLNSSKSKSIDCTITNAGYWDNNEVDSFVGNNISVNINAAGAICIAKNASYFAEKDKLEDSSVINITLEGRSTNNYLIICSNKSSSGGLLIIGSGSGSCGISKPQYLLEWSRFGTINKFKWNGSDWKRQ